MRKREKKSADSMEIFNPFYIEIFNERRKTINKTRNKKRIQFFVKEYSFFQDQSNVIFEGNSELLRLVMVPGALHRMGAV